MKMQVHTHTHTHTSPSPSSLPYPSPLLIRALTARDSAFAAQAFLEIHVCTKQGCVVTLHDQRGRGHMVCVMTSRMGKTTATMLQSEDGDWSGDYRGPLLDGWYMCMNGRTVSASI